MTVAGRVKNGLIVLDEPIKLTEGAVVQVEIAAPAPRAAPEQIPTLLERLKPFVGMAEGLPSDASKNLDHYLYGTPKRP